MIQIYLGAAVLCMAAVLFWSRWRLCTPLPRAAALGRNLGLSVLAMGTTVATPLLFWAVAGCWGSAQPRRAAGALGCALWTQWALTFC
jgi:hypothetical protein